jgi:cold shock CspA family protein/ribosome-associated translation inhibitor RaiA
MDIPLRITFRNMAPSAAVEANIKERAAKLSAFYDGILDGHVIVEAPHRHHRKGKSYQVRIDLFVPGGELVVNREPKRLKPAKLGAPDETERAMVEHHEPGRHAAHEDLYVAIRDAFAAAGRKLQDYARRRRGEVKAREVPPRARITRLFPQENYGFLETLDGREIYFHKNAVIAPAFDRLRVGAEVQFAEELGEKGPQATSVRMNGG